MREFLAIAILVTIAASLSGAELPVSARLRFANAATDAVPDFQKHVVPLLGRLGCNGRACHGSFQGRGGFRLSLFGYDFAMDHAALTGPASSEGEARVLLSSPDDSLLIRKPSFIVDHEGGQRFRSHSWEHHLLKRWIESGANGVSEPRQLQRLELEPEEIVFGTSAVPVQLRVIAIWDRDDASGSTREDVTALCRFRTNDDSVATVDRDGQIESVGSGDTHVIAFYDNGVAAVPVMRRAMPSSCEDEHDVHRRAIVARSSTRIDEMVEAKLDKLGISPSALCTDSEFLRRISIDLTGTLPAPNEVSQFLRDRSGDKRRRKIDELLDRPAYAAWWANKLCDYTGCNPNQQAELGQETSVQWYRWIYERLRENVPYDDLVERIVLATGRNPNQSFDDYTAEMSSYFDEDAGNDFAMRDTMAHFWSRRSLEKPEDKALAFAYSFLGIRLQCAQCHKHPFAPWTQSDFDQFAQFFSNVRFGVSPQSEARYRELAKRVGLNLRGKQGQPIRKDILRSAQAGHVIPWREVYIAPRPKPVSLRLLRSQRVQLIDDEDPRRAIMQWMRHPGNPWFARALVNRVWASYFHRGIIEPPDDLSPANPPSNPELLQWLCDEFVRHDYDMRWLHRVIVSSDAYQRSWIPNQTNRHDKRNFSRAVPRRIPAEVVYDALKQATAHDDKLDEVRTDLTRRAIGHLSMQLAGTYAMHVFGKPERAVNCDCERVNQPTLLQSVFLQNDPLVEQRLAASEWLQAIAERERNGEVINAAEMVRSAWLRTVSRPPTQDELSRGIQHIVRADSHAEAVEDVLWALINTKEFILNH